MKHTDSDKKKRLELTAWMLLGVSIVILYITNRYVPFMMDDLWYSTKLFSDEPIRSLSDIVQSQIWESGAANYLYMAIFQGAFAFCYLREVTERRSEKGNIPSTKKLPGISLWIVPLGLIAGWSNENLGPALWILTITVMVLLSREKRKIPIWMYSGSLSCMLGRMQRGT